MSFPAGVTIVELASAFLLYYTAFAFLAQTTDPTLNAASLTSR